ncbi:TPA: hypothetical protein DCX16_02365 [bacterium]|nr:hypothetical protein [bacterium]
MKKNIWIVIGVVVIGLAIVLVITQIRKEPKEIKIGAILPLTGPSALLGEMAQNGLLLAEKDINQKDGINGRPLKLIFEDGQADPKTSISAFRKLIDIENVKVVFVTHSSVGLALAPIADKEKVVLLVHASHPKITGISPYIFRHSNVAEQESEVIAQFVSEKLNAKRTAIAVMDDDYGMVFKETLEKVISTQYKDTSLVKSIVYESTEIDFKTVAQKLLDGKPDVVLIAGLGSGVGILIKRLKEYRYKGDIVITLGAIMTGAFESAADAGKEVYYVTLDIDEKSERYEELDKKYKDLYKSSLSAGPLVFYNSLMLISEAIKSMGNKPENISQFIANLSSFDGIGEKMDILRKYDIVPKLKVVKR